MAVKKRIRIHLIVILGYILFIIFNYWTLLSGNNIMKWDIMQCEYPSQVMMSDAIANGTLPLWNPLMNMGMPYYSIAGMPVWYPITLLLACFGYTPWTISLEYTLHLLIAAYGMFLLSRAFLKDGKGRTAVSFIMGLLYCSSGIFLSNAEHIMFIISAAWFPYIFYCVKRYADEKRIIFLLSGALFAGFIMLGGYPEMFYDLFMVLVPYFLYLTWERNKTNWQNILTAAGRYIFFSMCTIASCAITLLPFIHVMSYITRTANVEQAVTVVPFSNLLSAVLPKAGYILNNCEISMCNYYISIIALLSVPCLTRENLKKKWALAGISVFAFVMSWGEYSPFYMFCHKYLPLYASFRFPTVFRPLITIFVLLLLVEALSDMLNGKAGKRSILIAGMLMVFSIWGIWIFKQHETGRITLPMVETVLQGDAFRSGMQKLLMISLFYIALMLLLRLQRTTSAVKATLMIFSVILELSIFIQAEMPITISYFDTAEARDNPDVKQVVQEWYRENSGRQRSGNFSGNARSTTRYLWDTKYIVFGKTFDDEGYLSVKLEATEQYKQSYNRAITEGNPVAYFTNDIVDSSLISLEDWRMKGNVPRGQIYIDIPVQNNGTAAKTVSLSPTVLAAAEGKITAGSDKISFVGSIPFRGNNARYIKLLLEEVKSSHVSVIVCFEDITGTQSEYEDIYPVRTEGNTSYIELFFLDSTQDYSKVTVHVKDAAPVNMEVLYTEKMIRDNYVTLRNFSHNDVSLNVQAPSAGYVVLLQSDYPGWSACVDGQPINIQTVNGCFIGIPVNQGEHEISLKFRPIDFYIGAGITALYLLILIVAAAIDNWNVRQSKILSQQK